MPEHGMTCSPVVVAESADGQHQQVDFSVVSNQGRAAVTADNNQLDMESDFADYVWDADSQSYRHAFADADFEHYTEDPAVEELRSQDYFDAAELTDQDMNFLQESVGGAETYMQLTTWAAHNLSDETINAFDSIVATKDTEEIHGAIQELYDLYKQHDGDSWYHASFETEWVEEEDEYESDEEEFEAREVTDEEMSALIDIVDGVENYQMLMSFAQGLPQEFIDTYDSIMSTGNVPEMAEAIETLVEIYNNSIDEDDDDGYAPDYDTDTGMVNGYY